MAKRSKRKKGKKIKFKESPKEVIIKTKADWLKKALVNKKNMKKIIITQLKIMMPSGRKKEKELHG